MEITQVLTAWYDINKRDLPWRKTRDPYRIWLSEIILQQTRVVQGLDYYHRFVEKFPTVNHLAGAAETDVLNLWQGLGYYTRARNMHKTAKVITSVFGGEFPDSYDKLLKLKGIGPYTASAIASIAFGKPIPVLDGNVARVVSRLFAITEPVNENSGKKLLTPLLEKLIDKTDPGKFNQAVMEFGALWCVPNNPQCEKCVLSSFCMAYSQKIVERLPVKTKKVKQRKRYFNYFVIRSAGNDHRCICLRKRTEKDIWQGLYDFPVIETTAPAGEDEVLAMAARKRFFNPDTAVIAEISGLYRHQLTHQLIFARFFSVEAKGDLPDDNAHHYYCVAPDELNEYPLPRLIEKFLSKDHEF